MGIPLMTRFVSSVDMPKHIALHFGGEKVMPKYSILSASIFESFLWYSQNHCSMGFGELLTVVCMWVYLWFLRVEGCN